MALGRGATGGEGVVSGKPSILLTLPGEPTLDSVIARHPAKVTDAELDSVIAHLRAERAAWLTKEQNAAAKKQAKASALVEEVAEES